MDIKEKLQEVIDELFISAPNSRAAYDLREEVLANCTERYEDLTANGMPEEEAFHTVIHNIGNVDELLAALPSEVTEQRQWNPEGDPEAKKRAALITTIAVGLYILAGVVFLAGQVFLTAFQAQMAALLVAIVVAIVPTCMLVYSGITNKGVYRKQDDTVVENFKAWNANKKRRRTVRLAISVILWCVVIAVYFSLSFVTGAWHMTWLFFILGFCAEAVITLVRRLKEL